MKSLVFLLVCSALSFANAATYRFNKLGGTNGALVAADVTPASTPFIFGGATAGSLSAFTLGTGLTITNGVLSVTGGGSGSSAWGEITGTLADQTDLQAALTTATNAAQWGSITGTLADQADLQAALDAKQSSSALLNALGSGYGAIYPSPGLIRWNGTGYAIYSGVLPVSSGSTGINSLLIAKGDMLYASASGTWALLSGPTSASMQVLTSTGTGLQANSPAWTSAASFKSGLSLNLVENTALSTWAGTGNITTVGTITSGTWRGATVQPAYGGTGQTTYGDGQLLIGSSSLGNLMKATLTAGSGITVTNGAGSITLSIANSAITDAMLAGSISNSKLATNPLARSNHTGTQTLSTISDAGTLAALNSIASANITDGTIVDADVSSSAAIAISKLAKLPVEIVVACSDETTALTTGTAKVTFRMPHAMTLTSVRLNVNTAPTGSVIIVDVKEAGTTIFSTKPQIATSAFTSVGGAVPGTLSDTSLADDAEITINLDQIGSTIAGKGLKVTLVGTR